MTRLPPSIMIGCIFYHMASAYTQHSIFPVKGVMFLCASGNLPPKRRAQQRLQAPLVASTLLFHCKAAWRTLRRSSKAPEGLDKRCKIVDMDRPKGLGVVALESIAAGQQVLCEKPLLHFSAGSWKVDAQREFSRASNEIKDKVFSLDDAFSSEKSLEGILRTNAFLSDDSDDVSLCLIASRFNHSCNSNCEQHWDKELGKMTVYTCTGINAGEELCVRYIDIRGAYSYRQYMLQEKFGFRCCCEVCQLGMDESSDWRRSRMATLAYEVEDVSEPMEILQKVEELLKLYDEEGLHDQSYRQWALDAVEHDRRETLRSSEDGVDKVSMDAKGKRQLLS
eukprot:symbB.v1.2.008941.t1/scaffold563.1/size187063/18